jgi:hypothetical protein
MKNFSSNPDNLIDCIPLPINEAGAELKKFFEDFLEFLPNYVISAEFVETARDHDGYCSDADNFVDTTSRYNNHYGISANWLKLNLDKICRDGSVEFWIEGTCSALGNDCCYDHYEGTAKIVDSFGEFDYDKFMIDVQNYRESFKNYRDRFVALRQKFNEGSIEKIILGRHVNYLNSKTPVLISESIVDQQIVKELPVGINKKYAKQVRKQMKKRKN